MWSKWLLRLSRTKAAPCYSRTRSAEVLWRFTSFLGSMGLHYETSQWEPQVIMSALIVRWNLHRSSGPSLTLSHEAACLAGTHAPDVLASALHQLGKMLSAVVVLKQQRFKDYKSLWLSVITQQEGRLQSFIQDYDAVLNMGLLCQVQLAKEALVGSQRFIITTWCPCFHLFWCCCFSTARLVLTRRLPSGNHVWVFQCLFIRF